MATMKAVEVQEPGGPLRVVERQMPLPAPHEVRIKVQACGICHSDVLTKQGLWPGIRYPRIPGHEIAGVIDAIGSNVDDWKSGERVGVGWHGGHCGHCDQCRRGHFVLCRRALIPGISYDGGYAEYQGWPSGSSIDSEDTLAFSAHAGIKPMIEEFALERAAEAFDRMMSGRARFRVVLTT